MTVPLPLPDDPRLPAMIEAWPWYEHESGNPWPRSKWLRSFEDVLREHYPQSSSRQLSLTARGAAPFPLRDGPNVP